MYVIIFNTASRVKAEIIIISNKYKKSENLTENSFDVASHKTIQFIIIKIIIKALKYLCSTIFLINSIFLIN